MHQWEQEHAPALHSCRFFYSSYLLTSFSVHGVLHSLPVTRCLNQQFTEGYSEELPFLVFV